MVDFESLLFNIDIQASCIPRRGSLLIAEPFLREQWFRHAVICLIEYDRGGSAMGIVMNSRTVHSLQDLVKGVKAKREIPVFCGGPMSCDRLYFMHTLGDIIPGSRPVAPGLWVGGDFESMLSLVNNGYVYDGAMRFFLGYSGWGIEQLEDELKNHVWAVTDLPADPADAIRGEEDAYWHREVRRLGTSYRGWQYHPRNPHFN